MPYKPETRQYRSFSASNLRAVTATLPEVDEQDERVIEPSYKVRGYFTTFNQEYELYPRMGDWPAEYEQVDAHALDGVDTSDTIMQFDHNGPVMARTRNGSLSIGIDSHGAWCEADLSGCQQARDLFESIQNGLVDEMSFGFMIADDDDGRGTTYTRDEQGDYHTTITRIARLYDVSAVSCPANPGTEIHARSAIKAQIELDREESQRQREAEQLRIQQEQEAEERAEQERVEAEERMRHELEMLRLKARMI